MVQQQTNTATFYQGVPWGVLTLNYIVSYGSAANKHCHFLSGGSMGGAHLEWYCLIWFTSKQQILPLFIRGFYGGGGAHLEWYCLIWFTSKQQILTLFIRGFHGGCSPWMILSHMVQQQTTNTVTFYQGVPWGRGWVLTLNDIVSYGSAANNKYCHFLSGGSMGGCSPWMILSHMVQQQTKNTVIFYQGVPWGGAHLEWYCLIWFSSKQQILTLFIRGFHGGCSPWMILSHMVQQQTINTATFYQGVPGGCSPWMILSHMVQQQTTNTVTFYQGGSMGGGCSPWMILSHMVQQQTTNTATFFRGSMGGGCSPWMILSHMV